MSIAEMADAIHKELLALPEHEVRTMLSSVLWLKEWYGPDREERCKMAKQRLLELREKYKGRVKVTSPLNRAEIHDRKILR